MKARELESVAFIGTAFSMGRSFSTDRLASHGLTVIVPDVEHHERINRTIYEELVHGHVTDASRRSVVKILGELWDEGAEGVISAAPIWSC